MGMFDFLNSDPAEIQRRTAIAMGNAGKTMDDSIAPQSNPNEVPLMLQSAPNIPAPQAAPAAFTPVAAPVQANPMEAYQNGMAQAQQLQSVMPHSGTDQEITGNAINANAQAEGAKQEAAVYGKQAADLGNTQKQIAQNNADQNAKEDAIQAKIDATHADIANSKVDPNRLWANMGTGSKILAGIGLALSAFGGPEAVAKTHAIIQSAVKNDVDAQQHDYENKKEGAKNQDTIYARLRQRGVDKNQALLAANQVGMEQAALQTKQIAAGTSSKQAIGNADVLIGKIKQGQDAVATQLGLSMATQAQKPKVGDVLSPNFASTMSDTQSNKFIPGVGLALTDKDADYIKEEKGNYDVVKNGIDKVLALRNETGALVPGTPAHAALVESNHELQDKIRQQRGLKRISSEAMDAISSSYADPSAWQASTIDRLKSFQNSQNNDFVSKVKSRMANFHPSFAQSMNGAK